MTAVATGPSTAGLATPRQVIARGPEHPRLGQVATRAVDDRLAGAISAGSRPKDPPSHEPNEDGFLLRRDGDRVALLVLDGAGGFAAAAAVLDVVDGGLPAVLRSGAMPSAGGRLWASAMAARDAVRRRDGDTRRRPHVAVSLVLVEGDRTAWCATAGDTAVLAVGPGRVRLLTGVAPHLDHHAPLPQPQLVGLDPGEVMVGVSDGLFDALGQTWPTVVAAAVGDAVLGPPPETATAVAVQLVEAALQAGGPDHVTAVVLRP